MNPPEKKKSIKKKKDKEKKSKGLFGNLFGSGDSKPKAEKQAASAQSAPVAAATTAVAAEVV